MIGRDTVQELQKIVAAMGYDTVCQQPLAFAGAILDMCDSSDVKLLTNVLRSHYGGSLMAFFRDGSGDAATWTKQKTFLIDESGMSAENAEGVLDALWQAMGWQRPKPTHPKPEPGKDFKPKVDPKYKKDYIDTSVLDASAAGSVSQKVDPKYKKEYVSTADDPRKSSDKVADQPGQEAKVAAEPVDRPAPPGPANAEKRGLFPFEVALLLCFLAAIVMMIAAPDNNYNLDLAEYGIFVIPLLMSFSRPDEQEMRKKTPAIVAIMFILLLLMGLGAVIFDLPEKIRLYNALTASNQMERAERQHQLIILDIIAFVVDMPIAIQMMRYSLGRRKKENSNEE